MSFCWCTVNVENMEESIAFYKEVVCLELVERFKVGSDMEIAFLGSRETKVELIYNGSDK